MVFERLLPLLIESPYLIHAQFIPFLASFVSTNQAAIPQLLHSLMLCASVCHIISRVCVLWHMVHVIESILSTGTGFRNRNDSAYGIRRHWNAHPLLHHHHAGRGRVSRKARWVQELGASGTCCCDSGRRTHSAQVLGVSDMVLGTI
jgi:hypothetical protein